MDQGRLKKVDFAKKVILEKYNHFWLENPIFCSFGAIFTSTNACAVETKHGTKNLSNKKCTGEYCLLAKRIREYCLLAKRIRS